MFQNYNFRETKIYYNITLLFDIPTNKIIKYCSDVDKNNVNRDKHNGIKIKNM